MGNYRIYYTKKEYYAYDVKAENYEAAEDQWFDEMNLHMRSMLDRERWSGEPDVELNDVVIL